MTRQKSSSAWPISLFSGSVLLAPHLSDARGGISKTLRSEALLSRYDLVASDRSSAIVGFCQDGAQVHGDLLEGCKRIELLLEVEIGEPNIRVHPERLRSNPLPFGGMRDPEGRVQESESFRRDRYTLEVEDSPAPRMVLASPLSQLDLSVQPV